jgi:hypothetical protein
MTFNYRSGKNKVDYGDLDTSNEYEELNIDNIELDQ